MAKRKIVWSRKADIKLFDILDFYKTRNGNTIYSQKLYHKFIKELNRLDKQPELGIKTDIDSVRGLIVDEFILFYEVTPENIYVNILWVCNIKSNNFTIK